MERLLPEQEQTATKVAAHISEIIRLLGEDPSREGLRKTPMRAARALVYATGGYGLTPAEVVNDAIFDSDSSGMVTVKDIEFYSECEHHILPFFGKVSIGYIPDGKIIGISKLARLVDVYARRLQVQERMTSRILDAVNDLLHPKGAIVVCEARHLCMMMRGVEKQDSSTVTVVTSGLLDNHELKKEFLLSLR